MTFYDDNLKALSEKVARKKKLEAILMELKNQRTQLMNNANELAKIKQREQADVDKLEGRTLTALIYSMVGKKEEKLDKEKQEAYAAVAKYDVAVRELEGVEYEIRQSEEELLRISNCEKEYKRTLDEKKESLKKSGSAHAQEILELEGQLAYIENQKKEIKEAIYQGESAKNVADKVMNCLDEAEGLSTWDMLGGGMWVDMMKHEQLDEAQLMVGHLQEKLRRFKTELTDVKIDANFQVNMDGFTKFADYFFDGIFMDISVRDEIHHSQEQVENTRWQIKHTVDNLQELMTKTEREQQRVQEKLDNLVLNTTD